jgi:Heterokaryon incompatibility protein (HET)
MTYQYRPLERGEDEIRLVSLLSGDLDDPIRISIYHTLLTPSAVARGKKDNRDGRGNMVPYPWSAEETFDGDALYLNKNTNVTSWAHPSRNLPSPAIEEPDFQPHFEALSYTWGTTDDPERAYVIDPRPGGNKECATLAIYQNLASAFRHLRHVDQVRTFWVDAICINQGDIPERNKQVKRMANIYKLAYRVVAWLGIEEYNSTQALATLQYVGDQLEVTIKGRLVRAPGAEEPDLWMNACCFSFDDGMWQALLSMLERSWFYRLWCWQEINLSSRHTVLQCGQGQILWTVFRRAVLCLHNKERLPSVIFRERCRHIAYLTADAKQQPMSILLDLSRSKGCADARDKVYGLLGLTAPFFNTCVKTDYSLPVEQVYKDAFLVHTGVTQRLELLKHCVLARRSTGGSSWVPDWSMTDFAAPILSEQLSTGLSRVHIKYVAPSLLEVVGVRCTSVQTVSAAAPMEIGKALSIVPKWLEDLGKLDVYVNGETMIKAFALVLCMNRTRERYPTNHFLNVSEFVDLLREIVSLDVDSDKNPIYSNREIANTIQKIRGRAFFTTEDGHIGTAPSGIQKGEIDGMVTLWLH